MFYSNFLLISTLLVKCVHCHSRLSVIFLSQKHNIGQVYNLCQPYIKYIYKIAKSIVSLRYTENKLKNWKHSRGQGETNASIDFVVAHLCPSSSSLSSSSVCIRSLKEVTLCSLTRGEGCDETYQQQKLVKYNAITIICKHNNQTTVHAVTRCCLYFVLQFVLMNMQILILKKKQCK